MKRRIIIFTLILIFSNQYRADALNAAARQKYPYELLTDDYEILKEEDLNTYKEGVRPAPFSPKEGFGYIYWQCFPRDHVSINLEEMGYSSEDIGWHENYSNLKITAYSKPGVFHDYIMRRPWPVTIYEKRFNLWIKLMKGEQYVCLAGSFIKHEEVIKNGAKQQLYLWEFDKIKTKKGSDSYFKGFSF